MDTKKSKLDYFRRNGVALNAAGLVDTAARFVVAEQYLDRSLWKHCVNQFTGKNPDDACSDSHDDGWRGEYWGKMMRGAAMTYDYTRDDELYEVLTETVVDLLDRSDDRKSSYAPARELQEGWDVWCRKYVLLGLLCFRSICADDALIKRIDVAAMKMADCILQTIGAGKKEIYDTSSVWHGINSSSILEAFVLLYEITGEKRFLDFATYIIDSGMIKGANLVERIESDALPYQFPARKAYELISCVEGLLEYGLATADRKYVKLAARFADKILASDFTIVGAVGCEGELLDHSTATQSEHTEDVKQETCVTVTFMKLLARLFAVTGEEKYVAAFERSAFNALYGAVNLKRCNRNGGLPFDSYSPLIEETRARAIGGLKVLDWIAINGCCAAIGGAGTALVPRMLVTSRADGVYFNIYAPCVGDAETDGGVLSFEAETDYPFGGNVTIRFFAERRNHAAVYLRIPSYARQFTLAFNGKKRKAEPENGYCKIESVTDGDVVTLILDMDTSIVRQGERFAVERGAVVYAADSRYADPAEAFDPSADFALCEDEATAEELLELYADTDSDRPCLVPYCIAGNDWRSKVTVWLRRQ